MRGGYGISIDGLESRFEVLNVTNTPHFVNPAANVSNLQEGLIRRMLAPDLLRGATCVSVA